ncbi:MAG TPA: TolC family protein [Chryseosolibacter sp.]|nr:TolC family protein [Chryseosolibacter sp.]
MKLAILLLVISTPLFGQTVDYNKIILPESSQATEFEEKLVQLAWRNHPTNEAVRRELNIADYDVKQSNVSWLENIRVTGNINEFTINKAADPFGRAAFFPKYNISASISLGTFFTTPYTIRKSKEARVIAQTNINAQKLLVRNEVLKLYNEYLMRERIFKLQTQALLDNETSHKLEEQRFRRGDITFDLYSTSLAAYNEALRAQLEAERDYKNAKLDLEQWIGMRLEDVR